MGHLDRYMTQTHDQVLLPPFLKSYYIILLAPTYKEALHLLLVLVLDDSIISLNYQIIKVRTDSASRLRFLSVTQIYTKLQICNNSPIVLVSSYLGGGGCSNACVVRKLMQYSLVPIGRTGSINRHSSFIQPNIFTKI